MSETKSLLLAAFLSAITVITWQFFFYTPKVKNRIDGENQILEIKKNPVDIVDKELNRKSVLQQGHRLKISTNSLHGSINLKGARFDDITLAGYRMDTAYGADEVVLLSPAKARESYFAEFGWVSLDNTVKLPNTETVWELDKGSDLAENESVTLKWDNDNGLLFKIKVRVDKHYLFYIDQYIVNNTDKIVKLIPYGRLNRVIPSNLQSSFVFHEGPIATFDNKFEEFPYNKVKKQKFSYTFDKGWFGFADKYWFAAIVPFSNKPMNSHMKYVSGKYQLDFTHDELVVEPNTTVSTFSYLFTGAKNINILDKYAKDLHIKYFDRVVDFGILYFITKPIFLLLQYLNYWLGNFGLAILILTVFMRIILLPLSMKATVSMLKMKKIRPELQKVKKLYASDKVKLNQEVMSLFKKHQITPMAGLLPSILQIPMFFALYKVLSITIEMRQAPFYGWIHDLSVKDPTNIFTLFGMLHWDHPQILSIGVLPIILGLTMMMQQKMSSSYQSYDSVQADAIKMMPYIFTFLFASFPAGLVLYWVWNNILSILQQVIITKIKFKT
ncbi:MAG: membrane protein insertase YidC [Rickettsiaceae bacterium H1]|nr:membrane protein insertase YidC [Rickettsiaceae bacterium H1]